MPSFRARGRFDLINNYFCNVRLSVAEQPYTAGLPPALAFCNHAPLGIRGLLLGETRIGKAPSPTFSSLAHVQSKMEEYKASHTPITAD